MVVKEAAMANGSTLAISTAPIIRAEMLRCIPHPTIVITSLHPGGEEEQGTELKGYGSWIHGGEARGIDRQRGKEWLLR